ncbi:calcium-binding protein [Yersinia canariae]|uniref:Calcium-binding protein n=1 Tax=Yersinia canariae TaxID=2607663 RepID=A0A857F148_9GAMM|nr:calcium-binding protein [Yersinia canariae]QHB33417.1 calcium-binding protein [Yersinia canariae]
MKKINHKKTTTPITGALISNGDMKSIFLDYIPLDKVFFQYEDSKLKVIILFDNNHPVIKTFHIIKNGKLLVKSVILHDKNGVKNELFLTLNETKKRENLYDGPSKELLLTRNDLKYNSAQHLITNNRPSNRFVLTGDENLFGHKYIRNEVIGGEGKNTIIGGDKNDNLAGGDGNDLLQGYDSFDSLFGQDGNDILVGGKGNDGLAGGAGDDFLDGGEGEDELHGDSDSFSGFARETSWRGNDKIFGGEGNDYIEGGRNNDYLAGGHGNDMYVFSSYEGINLIVEYSGEENTISIDDYFFHELKFERFGNHLMISSTEDHSNNLVVVIKDQYSIDGYKVKHLQTKSYLRHHSEHDKKNSEEFIVLLAKNYAINPEDSLSLLAERADLGDFYRTDLSHVFSKRMPDIEKLTEKRLINVLGEKNNELQLMYLNNPAYFGENLPEIAYISEAISSFSPKEAFQENITYSKYSNISIDKISNLLTAINN